MRHSLILFILTLFIAGCSKPYIPCSGDDPDCFYFVCKVDGEKWVPSCEGDGIFGCYATDVQYYRYTGTNNLYIYIENDNLNHVLALYKENAAEDDKLYRLDLLDEDEPTFFVKGKLFPPCGKYLLDTISPNYLILNEIDTTNFVVGGEFEFTGQDTCGKVVNITEGSFRLRYRF